jgi:hypothetical protein
MNIRETIDHARAGQQPEETSGRGLAQSPAEPLPYADVHQETEPTEQRGSLVDPTGTGTLERTEQRVRKPQKTGAQSPFLNALVARLVFDAKNQVLETENRQLLAENEELLAEKQERAEKDERRRKQNREAAERHRQKDPEAYKARNQEEQRRSRERKKQQA